MLAIKGIYDGNKILPLEKFPNKKKYKVLITFVEEIDEDEELRSFSSQMNSFKFWKDKREDIYQEYLQKMKK
jgi:hypothetical protein